MLSGPLDTSNGRVPQIFNHAMIKSQPAFVFPFVEYVVLAGLVTS